MPKHEPAQLLKPFDRDALIHAAYRRDTEEIDAITDRLAEQGVCRPRADQSRMAEWIARRPPEQKPAFPHTEAIVEAMAATEQSGDIGSQLAAHFRGIFAGAQQ